MCNPRERRSVENSHMLSTMTRQCTMYTHTQLLSVPVPTCDIFLRVGIRFRLPGENSSQPTGGVNSTPINTASTELHSMITFHHANTRGSRVGTLRIAHLCFFKKVCHPRVMSRSLPRMTLTTSTSSLSSASPIFPTVTTTRKSFGTRSIFTLRCSTAEWRINTNPISHMKAPSEVLHTNILLVGFEHERKCSNSCPIS